jgi:predicted HAD superfamily Cof-like phosphohydrolase
MNPMQQNVRDFHVAMQQLIHDQPSLEGYPFELRARLILEEALEYTAASGLHTGEAIFATSNPHASITRDGPPDHAKMIDALCDILYVTFGAAVSMGIDLVPFFNLVHKANMLKSTGPVREDGKRLKPPGWKPPDIEGLLQALVDQHQ